ncbi:MAG: hypothetical protein QOH57_3935 [Mycobacterium sp.]|jgi:hypothetical protein|nr:hypothetical protein [Mycobacterium sp.]
MRTEPFGTEAIERYLSAHGLRYFRGHHDGEFFFIMTVDRSRFHVHLGPTADRPDGCTIRVTPACFFRADDRARLLDIAHRWNYANPCATALVHESSDPARVGVDVEYKGSVTCYEEFGYFADHAIESSVKLFRELSQAPALRDAS